MLAEALSSNSTGEGSAFKFIHTAVDRILPALAVDWRLLPVLCHKGFPIRQLITWQPAFSEQGARRARERRQKQEGRQSFATSSYHFCCIVFIRGEASPHSGEGDITRAWTGRWARGAMLEAVWCTPIRVLCSHHKTANTSQEWKPMLCNPGLISVREFAHPGSLYSVPTVNQVGTQGLEIEQWKGDKDPFAWEQTSSGKGDRKRTTCIVWQKVRSQGHSGCLWGWGCLIHETEGLGESWPLSKDVKDVWEPPWEYLEEERPWQWRQQVPRWVMDSGNKGFSAAGAEGAREESSWRWGPTGNQEPDLTGPCRSLRGFWILFQDGSHWGTSP